MQNHPPNSIIRALFNYLPVEERKARLNNVIQRWHGRGALLQKACGRCKTQKCLLEPFAELRKVWWSCKLCLSMLSENKTTKVRLAAFINVIEDVFKMSCLIDKIC